MSDPVQDALNQAEQAANAHTNQQPPTAPPGYQAVPSQDSPTGWALVPAQPAQPAQPQTAQLPQTAPQQAGRNVPAQPLATPMTRQAGRKLTMNTVQGERGTLAIDNYLKVDENGIKVKFNKEGPNFHLGGKLLKELVGVMDFSTIQIAYGLRAQHGDNVTYYRSLDGITSVDGRPWSSCIQEAKNLDPENRGEYPMADVVIELTEPAISLDGVEILPVGAKVGYSTTPTQWKGWSTFYQHCMKEGWIEESDELEGEVPVVIGFTAKTKGSNTWGVWTYQIDDSEDSPEKETEATPTPAAEPAAEPAKPARRGRRAKKIS